MMTKSTVRTWSDREASPAAGDLVPASPMGLMELDDDFLGALSGGEGNSRPPSDKKDPAENDPIYGDEDDRGRDPFDVGPRQEPCIPPDEERKPDAEDSPRGGEPPSGGGDGGSQN
jgi:mersacidin/lichenicidin family type 2 lantibiotic